jgi:Zn-dependent protease
VSSTDPARLSARACLGCGAELPLSFRACPTCGRLVHAQALKTLAAEAEASEKAGDVTAALGGWRQALDLLPTTALQYQRIAARVETLSKRLDAGAPATGTTTTRPSGWKGWLAGLGAAGLLLAKFKWVLLLLLSKGKLLLVGLTQAKTFLSMALTLGLYATQFGWRFAAGIVVSIYIHEMGHVASLRRYGIPATAPMFIPGLGAFVRLKQHPATPGEDARVGLAGPIWGAAAAIGALLIGIGLHAPTFLAIARIGAWINLFNLIPVWQLDGGRGFAALSRKQRTIAAVVVWALALGVGEGMLFLVAIGATFRAATSGATPAPVEGDRSVLATYLALCIGLTALMAGIGK